MKLYPDSFMTLTNRLVRITDPRVSDISLYDLSHGLALVNRFGGQMDRAYSVAQHSVLVSKLVRREHAVLGLFHDASEAYLGDCISPLKQLLPEYKVIERRWQLVIGEALGLGDQLADLPDDVHQADRLAFHLEWREVTPTRPTHPDAPILPNVRIPIMTPEDARHQFLRRFEELTGKEIG